MVCTLPFLLGKLSSHSAHDLVATELAVCVHCVPYLCISILYFLPYENDLRVILEPSTPYNRFFLTEGAPPLATPATAPKTKFDGVTINTWLPLLIPYKE